MNIFEFLSFDIGEFVTSLPGILIISGIVLLILALIILSTGKKKAPVAQTVVNQPVEPQENVLPSAPEAPVAAQPATFDNSIEGSLADMSNVANIPAPEAPVIEQPVQPVEVKTVVEATPTPSVVEQPVATPENVNPNITINPDFSLPKVESLDVAAQPIVAPTPVVNEAPVVAPTPVAPIPVVVEAPRPIYGGANPLENTAQVPIEAARQAYSGTTMSQPIPTIQPVIPDAPAVEPKVEAPVVAPATVVPAAPVEQAIPQPVVQPVPVVNENVQPQAPAAATEIETLEF